MINKYLVIFFVLLSFLAYSQTQDTRITEDRKSKINNSLEKQEKINKAKEFQIQETKKFTTIDDITSSVDICSNGGFEEFDTDKMVKDFYMYSLNSSHKFSIPQCETYSIYDNQNSASDLIKSNFFKIPKNKLNFNSATIATSVPSNYSDKYMGNIKASGQYALRIGDKESFNYISVVASNRKKTSNNLNFNYKIFFQYYVFLDQDQGHQPFFKARIIDKNGVTVSSFCIVNDNSNQNCVFSKIVTYDYNNLKYPIYNFYSKNWTVGHLDLTQIVDGDDFTVEFVIGRCGGGRHFSYVYIDDICLE